MSRMSESDSPNPLVRRFDPFAKREVTAEEKEHHEEQFPDDEKLLKRKTIECSSCGKDIRRAIVNDHKLCIHPALDVIICNKCEQFYNDGEFSVDEDGSDKYCRWCGQGGNLYCCCACSVALCSRCVKRNLPRSYSKEIERDDWKCFVCDPEPIWTFRALCYAAKRYVGNQRRSTKTSKRPRALVSNSESDVDTKVTKKRSKREEEDSANSHSEEEEEDSKPTTSRNRDSDSDGIWASSTKKRSSRSRAQKSPWPVKTTLRPRRAKKVNSDDESSSASNTRTSRRNRRANSSDSSAVSAKAKRTSRRKDEDESDDTSVKARRTSRRKDEDESDDTSFATPTKRVASKRPSKQPSPKKEKDLLGLAVMDSNNDLRQYAKVLTKNQSDFETKYVKNKKDKDSAQWQKIKDKYLKLLNNSVDCIVELRDSFLKIMEKIEKEDESKNVEEQTNGDISNDLNDDTKMNGDESPTKENESRVDEHSEEADVQKTGNDETIETNDTTSEETAASRNGVLTSADESMDVAASRNEVSTADESMDVQIGDSIAEEDEKVESSPEKNVNESPEISSPTDAEKSVIPSNHSEEGSPADSVVTSPRQNGHAPANGESDCESKANEEDVEEKIKNRAELRDHCTVKLARIPDPPSADPGQTADSEESTTIESELETSRTEPQQSDTDGGETKKNKTGRAALKQPSFFESTRIDSDSAQATPAKAVGESKAREDEARKRVLASIFSSEDEEGTDLNESSVIGGTRKSRSRVRLTFDSDLGACDGSENENHSRKSSELPHRDISSPIKDKDETHASNSENEVLADKRRTKDLIPSTNKAEDSMKADDSTTEERVLNEQKEEQAKKSFLDSDGESHVSDSDADHDIHDTKSSANKQPLNEEDEEVLFSDDSVDEEEGENESKKMADETSAKEETAKNDFLNDSSPETTSQVAEENAKNDFLNDSSPENTSRAAEETAKNDFLNDSSPENTSHAAEEDAKNDLLNDSSPEEKSKKTVVRKFCVKPKNTRNKEEKAKKGLLDSSSSDNSDTDDCEKEIQRLTNLNALGRKRQRPQFSSGDEVVAVQEATEVDPKSAEKTVAQSSAKKKRLLKSKTSLEHYLTDNDDESSQDDLSFSTLRSQIFEKQKCFATKEDVAKKLLLGSSTTDESGSDMSDFTVVKDVKPKKRAKKEKPIEAPENDIETQTISDSSDDDMKKSEATASDDGSKKKKNKNEKWKNDPLLRGKLSATDSSDEERMIQRARKTYDQKGKKKPTDNESSGSDDIFVSRPKKPATAKRKRFVLHSSNSEEEVEVQTVSSSSSSSEDAKKAKQKTKKKKRRRIANRMSDDSSAEEEEANLTQSSLKGRKNIREIMKVRDLDAQTRRTGKEEEARKKRIAERQALFNKVFEVKNTADVALKKLVLDYDTESKTELVTVSPKLLEKLKPHQADGVKFMWNACFESLKQVDKGKGGGCILAHCMGLGKTLQVISLIHTLLRHEKTKIKTVLVICPLTTVLNWRDEFDKWLEDLEEYSDMNVYELTKYKNNAVRADHLRHWASNGGIMILGYEMFRSLVNAKNIKEKVKKQISSSLLDPGPDLVICDEGHILKNEKSAISKATMKINSLRRIVLTGTPLQNNLIEYHCMVQFVKPNLLGNKKEFQNRFVNPITNGQYVDSTPRDVRLMKSRAHILHRILDGIVQRFDYNVLKPFLPPKHEFVISVALSDLQAKLYEYYIKNKSQVATGSGAMRLFKDYQVMRLIWTHPLAMKLSADQHQKKQEKEESDSSMKNFVVSGSESEGSASDNSVVTLSSGDETKPSSSRLTRAKKKELGVDLDAMQDSPPEVMNLWWNEFVSGDDLEDYKQGPKLMLLFAILRQCELIGDKVLIFSQSIPSLDMIEYFLTKNEEFSQRLPQDNSFAGETEDFVGTWEKNKDYYRLDGQTPNELRSRYCKSFNNPNNSRIRLFLISTKAGGLGINLTAANRVIIFDASWNPSYDIQSIFRVYRFGQTKPCYIYRFLSQGTMEEKIYERQVTKLSVSCRVVDEQQIDRHFSRKDITELYTFNRKTPNMDEVPKLPSDRLMAELLKEYRDIIINYHEHDSLLENIENEELTEEERKAAWQDYEDEKNRPAYRPAAVPNVLLQEVHKTISDQSILQTIKKLHPAATPQQLAGMLGTVRQKLVDYYLSQAKAQNPDSNVGDLNPVPGTSAQNSATDPLAQNSQQLKQAVLLQALHQNPFPSASFQPIRAPQVAPRPRFVPTANNFVGANWRPAIPNIPGVVRPRPARMPMTPVVQPPPDPRR